MSVKAQFNQHQLQAYMIPTNNPNNHRHNICRKQKNNSLPAISFGKQESFNDIRNKISRTNNEITLIKARITTLKYQKSRNQRKKNKAKQDISLIHTVRQRLFEDRSKKQKFELQRQQQLEKLKNQANCLRRSLKNNQQLSKSMLKQKKIQEAKEERERQRQEESQIDKEKQNELMENREKVKKIRQDQLLIEAKLKEFNQSRATFAHQNHHQKIVKSLTQHQKVSRTLEKLRKREQRLLSDYKQSEVEMLESIDELKSLNPERKNINTLNWRNRLSTHVAPDSSH